MVTWYWSLLGYMNLEPFFRVSKCRLISRQSVSNNKCIDLKKTWHARHKMSSNGLTAFCLHWHPVACADPNVQHVRSVSKPKFVFSNSGTLSNRIGEYERNVMSWWIYCSAIVRGHLYCDLHGMFWILHGGTSEVRLTDYEHRHCLGSKWLVEIYGYLSKKCNWSVFHIFG